MAVSSTAQQPTKSLNVKTREALSQISGKLVTVGLRAPVDVLRDRWGVAHIYATNQHDLFFAQGFVVAQDRLFQMELWKRAGEGRLAELLGPSAVQRDINARLLRYRGDMRKEYESYAADSEAILQAFTDGINAEIRSLTAKGGSGLPIASHAVMASPCSLSSVSTRKEAFAGRWSRFRIKARELPLLSILSASSCV